MSKQIKISVLFVPERLSDAERLRDGFRRSQAVVKMIEVADDRFSTSHYGKIYFFRESVRHRQFALKVATEIVGVEPFEIEFRDLGDPNAPTLAIWLAGQGTMETSVPTVRRAGGSSVHAVQRPNKAAGVSVQSTEHTSDLTTRPLVKCPKCSSPVRADRLKRHLGRHEFPQRRRRGGTLEPYTKWPWQSNSGISKSTQKCRYCGKKSIYADSVCYQCQR